MYGYTNQQIIDDIVRTANGAESLSSSEYEARGSIGLTTVRYHFATWNKAVEAAGLQPNASGNRNRGPKLTDEELLGYLYALSKKLGKRPTEGELSSERKFSMKPYRDRWGSIMVAYEKAVEIHSEEALLGG